MGIEGKVPELKFDYLKIISILDNYLLHGAHGAYGAYSYTVYKQIYTNLIYKATS